MDRLESFDSTDLMEFITAPKIKVMGVGGAGNNILEILHKKGVKGVDNIALNTDANHLNNRRAAKKKVLGAVRTKGQGTGGDSLRWSVKNRRTISHLICIVTLA